MQGTPGRWRWRRWPNEAEFNRAATGSGWDDSSGLDLGGSRHDQQLDGSSLHARFSGPMIWKATPACKASAAN